MTLFSSRLLPLPRSLPSLLEIDFVTFRAPSYDAPLHVLPVYSAMIDMQIYSARPVHAALRRILKFIHIVGGAYETSQLYHNKPRCMVGYTVHV